MNPTIAPASCLKEVSRPLRRKEELRQIQAGSLIKWIELTVWEAKKARDPRTSLS